MRAQTNYNKVVGIKDGVIYLVNYTFSSTYNDTPFVGVTGSQLVPLCQAYVDDMLAIDGDNAASLAECYEVDTDNIDPKWWEDLCYQYDCEGRLFPGHDDGDTHYLDDDWCTKHFPTAVGFECIGGGRIFSAGMQFDVVFDQELLDEINRLEVSK